MRTILSQSICLLLLLVGAAQAQLLAPEEVACRQYLRQALSSQTRMLTWSRLHLKYSVEEMRNGVKSTPLLTEMWFSGDGMCIQTPYSWVAQRGTLRATLLHSTRRLLIQQHPPVKKHDFGPAPAGEIPDSLLTSYTALTCHQEGGAVRVAAAIHPRYQAVYPYKRIEFVLQQLSGQVSEAVYYYGLAPEDGYVRYLYHEASDKVDEAKIPQNPLSWIFESPGGKLRTPYLGYTVQDLR